MRAISRQALHRLGPARGCAVLRAGLCPPRGWPPQALREWPTRSKQEGGACADRGYAGEVPQPRSDMAGHFGDGQAMEGLPCNEQMALGFEIGPGALAACGNREVSFDQSAKPGGSLADCGRVFASGDEPKSFRASRRAVVGGPRRAMAADGEKPLPAADPIFQHIGHSIAGLTARAETLHRVIPYRGLGSQPRNRPKSDRHSGPPLASYQWRSLATN